VAQLWKDGRENLSACHPAEIRTRLNLQHQFVVINLGNAYAQLSLITFTCDGLELEPVARSKELDKMPQIERSPLRPISIIRPLMLKRR
jgi:hypothetical protein